MRLVRLVNYVVALLLTATTTLALGWNAPAAAADGNILPPFTVGEQWYIWQGYSSGTHTGTSQYGVDLTISTSATATAGKVVRAPMGGTIYDWDAPYGNLCVNTPDGRSYTMTHINAARTSGTVSAGEALGAVAAAGQAGNNGVAHLHFEMWSGRGCYNQTAPIPLDAAHSARMCGAPDLTATGPNAGNGTWSKTYFTGQTCGTGTSPQGTVDGVSSPTAGTFRVRGWAFDRDAATSPINIHVYIGGPAGTAGAEGINIGAANVSRPDVGAAFPGVGDNHGYDTTINTGKRGRQGVYVYAINVGGGVNVLIGQGTVDIADPDPFGNFESLTSSPHKQLRVQGWAIDPNAPTTPVALHAYVGGPFDSPGVEFHDLGVAALVRADVAAVFPGTGQNHGFDKTFTTEKPGAQSVFVYAVNQGPGNGKLLLSRTVMVALDTETPDTTIDSVNSDGITATVHFTSNEAAVTFECSTTGAPWTPCTSPAPITLTSAAGTIAVRATDVAGNVDPTPATATLVAATATPAPAAPAAPPAPTALRRMHVAARTASHDRIVLNVDPDWAKGNYRVLVQKKRSGGWKTVARTYTRGARDTRTLDPKAGTYRVVVKRKGFETFRSARLRLRR